jgi:hypothetical protein
MKRDIRFEVFQFFAGQILIQFDLDILYPDF